MENIAVNRLMRLINALSTEGKLEILSRLSENLKLDFHPKENKKELLLEELFGAWSDTDEGLAEEILKSRTISDKEIKFD